MFQYLRKELHVSWLVAAGCLGIVAGIVAAKYAPIAMFSSVSWLLTGTGLILFGCLRSRRWAILVVVLGGGLIGLWRGAVVVADSDIYKYFLMSNVELSGTVKEDSDINQRGQTVLRLNNVTINKQPATGTVWVTTNRTDQVRRSDHVIVAGKLNQGFGSFNAAIYGASIRHVERPKPGDIALEIRDWFAGGVRRAVSEPEASLGLGFLVGQRRGLPEQLDDALKVAGLTHIVVASGYNLTILVRLARRLFENISKYLSFIAAAGMILSFIAITGSSPSMSRAGLVAGLSLVAWYYGRRFHPLVLLPLAMAITLLVQPSYGWGDLGWQLSFAAFAGVMISAPLVQAYFYGDKAERPIRRILIETISAQVWTLPILLLAFGQVSVIAPIANLLILPFVPLAMLLTFIAGVGGLLVPSIANVMGLPAELILTYMTATIEYVGSLSWALQDIQITLPVALLLYAAIAGFSIYMWHKTRLALEQTSLVE